MPPPIKGHGAKVEVSPPPTYSTHSQSTRFPRDLLYRQHGFRIHSRPTGGGAIWTRNGHYYTEPEVDGIVNRERKEQERQRALLFDVGTGG